jgi:hypothetical protein
MILCPNCQHQEIAGALFCSECGAQLASFGKTPLQLISKDRNERDQLQSISKPLSAAAGNPVISLHLLESGQIIPLMGKTEFTLGRISEGQPVLPDIDLTMYGAYDKGVSRIHAVIKVREDRVIINDLGSSNGTKVNDRVVSTNAETQLNEGDIVALGKFKFQILMQS